jgi:hypothetical protein
MYVVLFPFLNVPVGINYRYHIIRESFLLWKYGVLALYQRASSTQERRQRFDNRAKRHQKKPMCDQVSMFARKQEQLCAAITMDLQEPLLEKSNEKSTKVHQHEKDEEDPSLVVVVVVNKTKKTKKQVFHDGEPIFSANKVSSALPQTVSRISLSGSMHTTWRSLNIFELLA